MPDPVEVTNSQRRLYRATYTPVTSIADHDIEGDYLLKGAFLHMLGLTPEEAQHVHGLGAFAAPVLLSLASAQTEGDYNDALRRLRELDGDTLVAAVQEVERVRAENLKDITESILEIDRRYVAYLEGRPSGPDSLPPDQGAASPMPPDVSRPPQSAPSVADLELPPSSAEFAEMLEEVAIGVAPVREAFTPDPLLVETLGARVASRLSDAMQWANVNEPALYGNFNQLMSGGYPDPFDDLIQANIILPQKHRLKLIAHRVAEIIAERIFDLVGLLHLERLVMTPLDVERGELLYSLPLAPRETVTLSHKEWTIHEAEYTRYIQDYLENYSEVGVAQSTELARTTLTQTRRQDATSANLTSLSAQAVNITSPIVLGPGSVVESLESIEESVTDAKTVTTKATSRTIQDHKVSFTLATVRGSEDWTSRLIRNPHADKTMTADYYRRMRRWRNELYRYGVRLTYDIVVPHPGRRVLKRYNRLREIDEELQKGFRPTRAPSSFNSSNWKSISTSNKVPLPPPPPTVKFDEIRQINHPTPGNFIEEIVLTVPANAYGPNEIASLRFQVLASSFLIPGTRGVSALIGEYSGNFVDSYTSAMAPLNTGLVALNKSWFVTRGPVRAVFRKMNLSFGTIRVSGEFAPSFEAEEAWRQGCWRIMREHELAIYQEKMDALRAERAALQRSFDAADTLSLRRIEREHIMLACLEWLFPFLNLQTGWFDNVSDTPTDFDRVMGLQASVLIKLMHTAIDWDAMLVTLLPFFWERIDDNATVFVDHPDPLHREFLRAGAARVVLPIRPGYEEDMLSLFDLGLVLPLGPTNPFKPLVDDVTAANAAFEVQTKPAGAVLADGSISPTYTGDYPLEAGKLIGRWHESMPTGALDLDVTTRAVITA